MKKVIVTSWNPVKMKAAQEAFNRMMPTETFDFVGINVSSGVSSQPMSDIETYTGAINRIENAFKQEPIGDFWIGIEGGIEKKGSEVEAFAWVVIKDASGLFGKGRSATFFLPPAVVQKIDEGMELGHASDAVFNESNSKQKQGTVGILTNGLIDRTTFYIEPAILALIPFINRSLFAQK